MIDVTDGGGSNDLGDPNQIAIAVEPTLIQKSPPETVIPNGHFELGHRNSRFFEIGQTNAIERLVALKNELRDADTELFWIRLMEGLTAICNAQCAFVAKNNETNGEDTDVEMLSLDERSSALLGVAVYYNDGKSIQAMHRDYKYLAWDIPCTSMNHDKVCLVPEGLSAIMGKDVDRLPFPVEAYLAVPLFASGKCFAHVGMLWTAEGLQRCDVSWPYLEMILHSLEDLILQHITMNESYHKSPQLQRWEEVDNRLQSKAHKAAVHNSMFMAAQAFKPYARSLSHELRTPMQGVVGMLDIMHATVQERIEDKSDPRLVPVFTEFRENIEAIQDSARRAIEAADNIVHAYNLNMQVPDTPQNPADDETHCFRSCSETYDSRPNIFIEGSNILVNPYKRRRSAPVEWQSPSSPKHRCTSSARRGASPRTAQLRTAFEESDNMVHSTSPEDMEDVFIDGVSQGPSITRETSTSTSRTPRPVFPPMVLHYTKVRDLLRIVVNESLQVGGRPDSARVETTEHGERIEVQTRGCNGQASIKYIDWWVDPSVPETLCVDEKDLTKLVSCVFLNALKFTEVGEITVTAVVDGKPPCVLINIKDTGTGIPDDFLPKLFKPWAREDGSTTRSKEGLGLGLMVAKGLSRKLCGDLICVHSSTTEPNRGSEFQIRLPIFPNESVSRPPTPYTTISTPRSIAPSGTGTEASHSPVSDRAILKNNGESSPPPVSPISHDGKSGTSSPNAIEVHQRTATRRLSGNSKPIALTGHKFDRCMAEKHPLTFLVAEDNKINRRILVSMLGKLGYHDVYEAFDGKEAVRIVNEVLSSYSSSAPPMIAATPSVRSRSNSDITLDNAPASLAAMDTTNVNTNVTQTETPPDSDQEAEKTPPPAKQHKLIDVVLMDLWMPDMDGYEATEKIFTLIEEHRERLEKLNLNADADADAVTDADANPVVVPPVSLEPPTVLAVSADVTDEALDRATKVGMEGYMTKPYKLKDLERLIGEFCSRKER